MGCTMPLYAYDDYEVMSTKPRVLLTALDDGVRVGG
jgi:hypothetical protein